MNLEFVRFYKTFAYGKIKDYIVRIDNTDHYCTCPGWRGWHLRKPGFECKHIRFFKNFLNNINYKFMEGDVKMRLPFAIPCLDELTDGGLPLEDMTLITGNKQVGKTILAVQTLHNFIAQTKQNGLYIVTEGGFMQNFWAPWNARFCEKFKLGDVPVAQLIIKQQIRKEHIVQERGKKKENENALDVPKLKGFDLTIKMDPELLKNGRLTKPAIITAFVPNLYLNLALVGRPGIIETNEKGHQKWHPFPNQAPFPELTPLGRIIDKYKIKMLIIDSITSPIKSRINYVSGNEMCRANIEAQWLGSLSELCQTYNTTLIAIAHMVSKGSTYTSIKEEVPWGGDIVGYHFKYILHLRRMPQKVSGVAVKDYQNKRQVYLRRWGDKGDMQLNSDGMPEYRVIEITDMGYIDPKKR